MSVIDDLRARGVTGDAEVHVAEAIGRLTGTADVDVLLGVALAVHAVRHGHVCLDLARAHDVGVVGDDERPLRLSLPSAGAWSRTLAASDAVRAPDDGHTTPLVLDGDRLYLDRYWRYEQRLGDRLLALGATRLEVPDDAAAAVDALFKDGEPGADERRHAASVLLGRRLTVLTGGPGTGKTTTVARLLALLVRTGTRADRLALSAPTGKAAARMAEAVRAELERPDIPADIRQALAGLRSTTLHRLLGWQPATPTRFRHGPDRPLAADVVIVDEASMVSLPLMSKLVDALPRHGRLVLVGDREQLASVDAGAVLGDITGVAGAGDLPGDPAAAPEDSPIAGAVVALTHQFRFGVESGVGALAEAIRTGVDPDRVVELLVDAEDGARLVAPEAGPLGLPDDVRGEVIDAARRVRDAAGAGHGALAIAELDRLRLLAPVRKGFRGVEAANELIARWVHADQAGRVAGLPWPVGTPVIVLRNDHRIELYNGDTGVVVADPATARAQVAFADADGDVRLVAPTRLPAVEPVYAMSVHKSQGSQVDDVVLVLPEVDTPLLTRELVYTAVTRARRSVTVVGRAEVLAGALARSVQRASGLRERLWGPSA